MGQSATVRAFGIGVMLALTLAAQTAVTRPSWSRIGNSSLLAGLSSPAGGPVERAWFQTGGGIAVRLASGRTLASADLENWTVATLSAPESTGTLPAGGKAPEAGALVRPARPGGAVIYAAGAHAWRSEDGGLNWSNLTELRGASILGGRLRDLNVDPGDAQRIVAAADTGVWLSVDGGLSWQGLNDGLPNLAIRRILAAPRGTTGVRIAVADGSAALAEMEWRPGQKLGWSPSSGTELAAETALRARLTAALGVEVTAAASSGDALYAGDSEGQLWSSPDGGNSWRGQSVSESGVVERILTDSADRNFAVAVLSTETAGAARVVRTLNGGAYWDDLTNNLPAGAAYGVAADRQTGALYVATTAGIYFTYADLRVPGPATAWRRLDAGLPSGTVARDVRLDEAGNFLLAAFEGYGVYGALAPHRARAPRAVHAADYSARAASPGVLLSILGTRLTSANSNATASPVLAATADESQIQVPFSVSGDSLALVLESENGKVVFGLPLRASSPAILVDRDGSPMLIDADSGVQLDAMHPARPGMRVQILMSGLGRVLPDWPTGLAAPVENAPRVVAAVTARLDGSALDVASATLAPGYIGYYLVEVRIPDFVNEGAAALEVESGGATSNLVRVYVSQ
jgi:uncharacterized protein (TIGR03437 family)